jgi:hypothetical protein
VGSGKSSRTIPGTKYGAEAIACYFSDKISLFRNFCVDATSERVQCSPRALACRMRSLS